MVTSSFLVPVHTEACIVVDDGIDSGRNHHIDIEVDNLVLDPVPDLVLAIVDFVDDEQRVKEMNLVGLASPLLQVGHGMGVLKKFLLSVKPSGPFRALIPFLSKWKSSWLVISQSPASHYWRPRGYRTVSDPVER